jgi:hypothetical protein
MPTLESLGIDKLSSEEKQTLIYDIYDSMEASQIRTEPTPEFLAFLRDRVDYAKNHPEESIPARDYVAKLLNELGAS